MKRIGDISIRTGVFVAWTASLTGSIVKLGELGRGPLNGPHLTSIANAALWLETRPPEVAVFAGLRLLTLALAWYLLASTALAVAVQITRVKTLIDVVDRLTPPIVNHMVATTVGIALATGPFATSAAAAQPTRPAVTAPVRPTTGDRARNPGLGTRPMGRALNPKNLSAASAGTAPTMRWLNSTGPPLGPAPPPISAARPADAVSTWTIRPGDHLWRVAQVTLNQAWGRQATNAEVVPFWRLVIATNRAKFVVPGNPSLVYPGQIFDLPPVPGNPERAPATGGLGT